MATVSTNVEGLLDLPTVHCAPAVEDLYQTMAATFAERQRIGQEQRAAVASTYTFANWSAAWLRVIEDN